MRAAQVGESTVILGILVIVISVAGLATGQTVPVDLETISWGGSLLVLAGMALIVVGN